MPKTAASGSLAGADGAATNAGSSSDAAAAPSDATTIGVERQKSAERQRWSSKAEFLITLVGYAVGLGNFWRFPYLCYKYGGGAFLVPYTIVLIVVGMPLFCLELGVGQKYQLGPLQLWGQIHPMLGGLGWASTAVTFFVALYYNVIVAWAFWYLGNYVKMSGEDEATTKYYIHEMLEMFAFKGLCAVAWLLSLAVPAWSVGLLDACAWLHLVRTILWVRARISWFRPRERLA